MKGNKKLKILFLAFFTASNSEGNLTPSPSQCNQLLYINTEMEPLFIQLAVYYFFNADVISSISADIAFHTIGSY